MFINFTSLNLQFIWLAATVLDIGLSDTEERWMFGSNQPVTNQLLKKICHSNEHKIKHLHKIHSEKIQVYMGKTHKTGCFINHYSFFCPLVLNHV